MKPPTWKTLLETLNAVHDCATSNTPNSPAMLEKSILKLGDVVKGLDGQAAPDGDTQILLQASLNRLEKALPHEKDRLRGHLTGLLKRNQANKAYAHTVQTLTNKRK